MMGGPGIKAPNWGWTSHEIRAFGKTLPQGTRKRKRVDHVPEGAHFNDEDVLIVHVHSPRCARFLQKFIQIPFLEKIARQACCKGSVNIALAVSDEEGAFPQKGVVRKSLQDHAWLGFTARTWMYQFLDGPFRRVVGTVIEMGNLTAGFFLFPLP